MTLWIQNGTIISLSNEHGVISNGYVGIQENEIVVVGEGSLPVGHGDIPVKPEDCVIDADGKIIMPGIVNAHMHCYSTFARGMKLPGYSPTCFVDILENLWWRLDKKLRTEDLYWSTVSVVMEGIRAGITTLVDHHASPYCIPGCLDELAKAFSDVGMRGILCYEVSDRDGKKIAREGIDENIRFIQKAARDYDNLLRGTFGLHASFTLDDDTLINSAEAARTLGVGVHIHVAEDHADQTLTLYKNKKRVVKRLQDVGALGSKSIAAHAVWTEEEEKRILAETGTWTVHNPRSNMNNAVGTMDLPGLMSYGAKVCLGSDGMASSIWPEIQTAALIHKHDRKNPRLIWQEIVTMLRNNAALASTFFEKPVGQIKPGALADIVIYDYCPPTPITTDNFLAHFLFGFAHVKAETVIIQGKPVFRNGKFTQINENKVMEQCRIQAESFWQAFAK